MPRVTVTVAKVFVHEGSTVQPGEPLELEAIDAAQLGRRGLVSLTRRTRERPTYDTRDLNAAPVAAVVEPEPVTVARRGRRRRPTDETDE